MRLSFGGRLQQIRRKSSVEKATRNRIKIQNSFHRVQLLLLTKYLKSNPSLKREVEALTRMQRAPLSNLTMIKLTRKLKLGT